MQVLKGPLSLVKIQKLNLLFISIFEVSMLLFSLCKKFIFQRKIRPSPAVIFYSEKYDPPHQNGLKGASD